MEHTGTYGLLLFAWLSQLGIDYCVEPGLKIKRSSGIAPFENTSGKYRGKTKVNHLANKRVKVLLSNGANSTRKWDPELRAYYARKIDEGKEHKLVINSI